MEGLHYGKIHHHTEGRQDSYNDNKDRQDSSGSVQQLIAKDEPLAQRAHQSGSALCAQSYGGKRQQIIYIAKRAALPIYHVTGCSFFIMHENRRPDIPLARLQLMFVYQEL